MTIQTPDLGRPQLFPVLHHKVTVNKTDTIWKGKMNISNWAHANLKELSMEQTQMVLFPWGPGVIKFCGLVQSLGALDGPDSNGPLPYPGVIKYCAFLKLHIAIGRVVTRQFRQSEQFHGRCQCRS